MRWKTRVDSQGCLHVWTFLAVKAKDVSMAVPVAFGEPDDYEYWNTYMRVLGGQRPYYDPLFGERAQNHPHSNVATSRKNRWPTWGVATWAPGPPETWKLEPGYEGVLAQQITQKAGNTTPVPVLDLAAWLFRSTPWPDGATRDDVVARFRANFHITDPEWAALFSATGFDADPETDDAWFATRRVTDDLLREITKDPEGFVLAEALATLGERQPPQPVAISDALHLLKNGRRQLVLQGPPGTGKTYLAMQMAAVLLGLPDADVEDFDKVRAHLHPRQVGALSPDAPTPAAGAWEIVQFHPSYSYEDFVRGIDAGVGADDSVAFFTRNKVFADLACRAQDIQPLPVVLIVDEINRADVSKVLGELIFALEYRGRPVRTPYVVEGDASVTVPDNLYVIGTMNTADRSIALIDYAIRRRFDFVNVGASREKLSQHLSGWGDLDQAARVLAVFDAVNDLINSTPDLWVGHAYFMVSTPAEAARRLVFQVLPLLHEYQREGLIAENLRLKPAGWPTEDGMPLVHPSAFDLEHRVRTWLASG
jgi:MoxR-like ATPase